MATVYRVKQRSYINGVICDPGALVVLPAGVDAGSNLEVAEDASGSPDVILPPGGANPASTVYNKAENEEPAREPEPVGVLSLLDGTVAEIKGKLAALSDADLQTLKDAEEAGKTRKGLIDAIEAEVKARAGGEF